MVSASHAAGYFESSEVGLSIIPIDVSVINKWPLEAITERQESRSLTTVSMMVVQDRRIKILGSRTVDVATTPAQTFDGMSQLS